MYNPTCLLATGAGRACIIVFTNINHTYLYDHSITFHYSYTQACHVVVGLDLLMQWRFLS